MTNMTDAEIRAMGEIVLISSVPQFLFRRLRENYSVRKIAERSSTKEIIADLRRWGKALPSAGEAKVMVYALLVALSLKNLGKYRDELGSLKIPVQWFPQIKDMVLGSDMKSSSNPPEKVETSRHKGKKMSRIPTTSEDLPSVPRGW